MECWGELLISDKAPLRGWCLTELEAHQGLRKHLSVSQSEHPMGKAEFLGAGGVWAYLELCLELCPTFPLFVSPSPSFPLAFVTEFSLPPSCFVLLILTVLLPSLEH